MQNKKKTAPGVLWGCLSRSHNAHPRKYTVTNNCRFSPPCTPRFRQHFDCCQRTRARTVLMPRIIFVDGVEGRKLLPLIVRGAEKGNRFLRFEFRLLNCDLRCSKIWREVLLLEIISLYSFLWKNCLWSYKFTTILYTAA